MSSPVLLGPPVRGEWGIFNPPNHPKLAYDFLAVKGRRDPYRKASLLRLLALTLFGLKVRPPFSTLGGNYVILDCGGVFPLYAHLRRGSVRVQPGQTVAAGELLGEVGNSGSSIQPHLHFQVMSSPDPFPLFRNLVPFALASVRCRRGGQWRSETRHLPANGDHYELD